MKTKTIFLILTAFLVVFNSCKTPDKGISQNDVTKTVPGITDRRWKLTEINGVKVSYTDPSQTEAFIIFDSKSLRISGNGGCNTLNGGFELKEGNRITISKLAVTMMYCPAMNIETQLTKVLEEADNYSISGNILSINKARMAPLARFEEEKLK